MLEFYVGGDFGKVSLKIGGTEYACKRRLHNWVSETLNVSAGTYPAEVYGDGKKIAVKDITFVKGIEEDDFGI